MRRLIRSLLSVPGNRPEMLEKARDLPADALHLDLEDAVPPQEKERARRMISNLIPGYARMGQLVMVRVNSLETGLTEADLDAVLSPELDGISLPKAQSAADVLVIDKMLSERELALGRNLHPIDLFLWIETAGAVLSAYEIALASPRTAALILGADDFTREMGIRRTKEGSELDFARWKVSLAARAAGIIALDTGYPDFRDEEGLASEAQHARQMGFQGKFLIHPGQIATANKVFSPSKGEVEEARRVVAAFEEALTRGQATTSLEGSLIDTAIAARAQRIIEIAETAREDKSRAD